MKYIFLLGSNIGNKVKFITESIDLVGKEIGKIIGSSKMYITEPWGFESENYFINKAIEVESELSEKKVLEKILLIEIKLGREPKNKEIYISRKIDIDIIFAEKNVIMTEDLIIPHPLIQERRFVLEPLNEIMPNFIHPVIKKSIRQMNEECSDKSKVSIFKDK